MPFVGLVTNRDVDFIKEKLFPTTPIGDVMIPRDKLITGRENLTLAEAYTILESEKKGTDDMKSVVYETNCQANYR